MSFMGMFGGMDMDKPFYKSRMFIGGTIACIALLGVEYYVRIVSFSFPPLPLPQSRVGCRVGFHQESIQLTFHVYVCVYVCVCVCVYVCVCLCVVNEMWGR